MNAMMKPIETMSVIERASKALNKAEVEVRIKDLVQQSKSIVAVTDAASRDVCHESLMVLKNMRVQTQKAGKEGRDEAVQYSKVVIAIEKELIALIEPEEARLAKLRDEFDSAKERERQAKIDAEISRVQLIQRRIADFREAPLSCAALRSDDILSRLADIEGRIIDSSFAEFEQEASRTKAASVASLRGLHAAAVARELDEQRIARELAELAVLRAAQQERDRVDQARRDAELKTATDVRNAEQARIAGEQKAQREAIQAQEREAAERIAAEDRRITDERAALAVAQEALRVASLPPAQARRKDPSSEQIIDCVAEAFAVDARTALRYIKSIDWDVVSA